MIKWLKKLLAKIAEIGIDSNTSYKEAKFIRMTNYQTVIVMFFLLLVIAQVAFKLPASSYILYNCLAFLIGYLIVFLLNYLKWYNSAKYFLSLSSLTLVSLNAIHLGGAADNHLFLMVVVMVSFFIFKDFRHITILAIIGFSLFAGLEFYFIDHGPLIETDDNFYIQSRLLSVLNMFLMLIFVTAYNFVVIRQKESELEKEKEKVESLLLNILPASIAERLKNKQEMIADKLDNVTVLFADIVGFTTISQQLNADELVELLNTIFSRFDRVAKKYGLEKIKTIGDAYMVAGGVPLPLQDHCSNVAKFALEINEIMNSQELSGSLKLRIGIHTGPVIAGVIGEEKFIYDLWGDTVNTASRMESHGIEGSIQVTEEVYQKLGDKFVLEFRGEQVIKGKGILKTYILISEKQHKKELEEIVGVG
jgi:adenylate cyclase